MITLMFQKKKIMRSQSNKTTTLVIIATQRDMKWATNDETKDFIKLISKKSKIIILVAEKAYLSDIRLHYDNNDIEVIPCCEANLKNLYSCMKIDDNKSKIEYLMSWVVLEDILLYKLRIYLQVSTTISQLWPNNYKSFQIYMPTQTPTILSHGGEVKSVLDRPGWIAYMIQRQMGLTPILHRGIKKRSIEWLCFIFNKVILFGLLLFFVLLYLEPRRKKLLLTDQHKNLVIIRSWQAYQVFLGGMSVAQKLCLDEENTLYLADILPLSSSKMLKTVTQDWPRLADVMSLGERFAVFMKWLKTKKIIYNIVDRTLQKEFNLNKDVRKRLSDETFVILPKLFFNYFCLKKLLTKGNIKELYVGEMYDLWSKLYQLFKDKVKVNCVPHGVENLNNHPVNPGFSRWFCRSEMAYNLLSEKEKSTEFVWDENLFSVYSDPNFKINPEYDYIFFTQPICIEYNCRLINILNKLAEEKNFNWGVKPHPRDTFDYKSLHANCTVFKSSDNSEEILKHTRVAIGRTSTVLLTAFELGCTPISILPDLEEAENMPHLNNMNIRRGIDRYDDIRMLVLEALDE